jgi:4-hydroxythreonine-4-phosphate dehydrogenase
MVFGSRAILERIADTFDIPMPPMKDWREGDSARTSQTLLMDEVACSPSLAMKGKPTAPGGDASIQWLETAIRLARTGVIDGIVTAPISKEAIHLGGHDWPGHTELLAARTGTKKPVMMMVGGGLRAALVTTHAALSDLPKLITRKNVLDTIRITHAALKRDFGFKKPRLCVCGFNPHAGEAGRFGRKEITAIEPAVRQAKKDGIRVTGPLPADVVFTRRMMPQYDAAIAMYHDQATIPVKLLAVETGVNVTLGLPIIRTSPDHGTAFDISKKGIADVGSIVAAANMAGDMARARKLKGGGR